MAGGGLCGYVRRGLAGAAVIFEVTLAAAWVWQLMNEAREYERDLCRAEDDGWPQP